MDTAKVIYDYIVTTFDIDDDDDFSADVNIFDYGYVDSMDAVKIVTDLESKFNIEITQRDLMLHPMNTINELAAVVTTKLGE